MSDPSNPASMSRYRYRLGNRVSLGAMVPACSILLFGCQSPETGGNLDAEGASEEVVDPDAPGVRQTGPNQYEAVIFAFEGGFEPEEVRVPVGAEVTFRVRSTDLEHGFLIEGTDVEFALNAFGFEEATYTFSEAGEYLFMCYIYCSGGHDYMRGMVIVEGGEQVGEPDRAPQ